MIIDELKSKNVKTLGDLEFELKIIHQRGFLYLPDNISNIVADISKSENPTSAIVLGSNFGEISSKLKEINQLVSIDASTDSIEVARHLNAGIEFINENPATYSKRNKFDLAIAFPPPGLRLDVSGRRIASEVLYIEKALDLLNESGKTIFIVPNAFLTMQAYSELRARTLTNYGLSKIIALPKGTIRGTGVEFSILEVKKSNISITDFYSFKPGFDIKTAIPSFSIPKEELSERWDFHFHNPQNQAHQAQIDKNTTKKIGDLVEVCLGARFSPEERKARGKYKLLLPRNIASGNLEETANDRFLEKDDLNPGEQRAIVRKGDILLPRFSREKVAFYVHASDDDRLIASEHIIILRGKNSSYVATYLNTDSGLNLFNEQIKRHERGSALPIISLHDLKNILVPILPIADLEYASKRKLEQSPHNELIELKKKYEALEQKYATAEEHRQQLQVLQQLLTQVMTKQDESAAKLQGIETKIDAIQSVLTELSSDFGAIKSLPRDIEDKLSRMGEKLDEQLSRISAEQKQIGSYIQEIKKWFDHYELLEFKSQKYLPEAEYILDKISSLENPDYSPFVIQYCRALENELLSKIFRAYVRSIIDRGLNVEEEFAWDFQSKNNGQPNDENTRKFVINIKKFITKDEDNWHFELGGMELVLRKLTGASLKRSPALQDLSSFVLTRFEKELLSIQYLDEIKSIIKDYRNQSAHPNLINEEEAMRFHKKMKRCLIGLMENYNKNNLPDSNQPPK